MRLVALLNYYDERPDFLQAVVASLPLAGVDHLVALEGSYSLFPSGRSYPVSEQEDAIRAAAKAAHVECTVAGRDGWESECEKRTHLFRLGDQLNADWFLVIDADEVILQAPPDLKQRLADTDRDYADCLSLEHMAPTLSAGVEGDDMPIILAQRYVKPRRCLIRAVPGIVVGPAHSDYFTGDGRNLWGSEYGSPLLVRDMVIDHRNRLRDETRMQAALDYRDARDAAGIERVMP
jgi:hypothetical protein